MNVTTILARCVNCHRLRSLLVSEAAARFRLVRRELCRECQGRLTPKGREA